MILSFLAVDNLVKDSDSLKNDVTIATQTLAKEGQIIAGRQVLLMVYASYKTSVVNGTVFDVTDVIAAELHGNHMEHSLHRWDKVILGLAEPMHENTKKAFIVPKVRNCPAFQADYLNWKRKSDDDPTKTFDALRTAMNNFIEDARRDEVREDELRGLSGYTGNGRGRQPTPAYPARQEVNTVAPRTETPAPNGGGNGRGRSRARRTKRSASPGVRSTASNDTKGNGKGKSIVGKWDVCISTKERDRALRPIDVRFPMIPTSRYMSQKEKVRGSAKVLIHLDPLRPPGAVGAIPPEVVRPFEDRAENAL